jgi:diguanylate cyclase (GGDEF)-like protein/PAS domain S-box-containing protein
MTTDSTLAAKGTLASRLGELLDSAALRKKTRPHSPGWTVPAVDVGTSRLDDELIAQKVTAERLRIFAERAFSGAITAPLGGLILAWMGSAVVGWHRAAIWFALFCVVELLLARDSHRVRHSEPMRDDANALANRLIFHSGLAGVAWGSSVWFFGVDGQFDAYALNLAFLVGVGGISVILMSPFVGATLVFFGGLLILPLVHILISGSPQAPQAAIGLAVFLLLLLQHSRIAGQQLLSDLESTARNELLAERLHLALGAAQLDWFDLNPKSGEMVASAAHAKKFGFGAGATQLSFENWLDIIHPDDRPAVHMAFHMQGTQTRGGTAESEYRIHSKRGKWLWVRSVGRVIETDRHGHALRIIGIHSDITEQKSVDGQIKKLAFYDHLTQLPNRRLLHDRLQHALAGAKRHGRSAALMLLDMDNFKALNDSLGHDVGDQLLVEVAQRLRDSVREVDCVARLGGDEFVVLLEDLDADELGAVQGRRIAEKILGAITEPYLLELPAVSGGSRTYSHHCTSSIGVTLFADNSLSADELLRRADTAMYQAKAMGRNAIRFFDPDMQAEVTARAVLENDLRDAVRERQFLLHFQPQVDENGRITGAEILVRWMHPRRGLVSPHEFIPVAEATGLIHPIGRWIIESACARLSAWAAQPALANLTLSVNVSAVQFRDEGFMEHVLATLEPSAINPQRLKLELTESLLLDDVEGTIARMSTLKSRGVGFSLDDFGTGYSSLSYLKRLPLDQLKIDQSFVRDILTDGNDAAIARTIVALGKSMGLAVIAEGVETDAQREFLAASACHAFQGYFFGRPMPIEEFERRIHDGH